MNKRFIRGFQFAIHIAFILSLVPFQSVRAAAQLEITPITWNVVGLDSNNVNTGPNNFPVGARVCNTGDATATNVSSQFNWEAVDPTPAKDYIDNRPGSALSYSGYTLDPNECVDFYYEVEVDRNSNAYNDTRRYYITATADTLGTVSTPQPREIFVEHLVSQNRNSTLDVQLDGASIAPGGTMALAIGETYTITLVAKTATNGYEQIESFINFPNTIFQVNSVNTQYSADSSPTVDNPSDMLYGDGCVWQNDPNSPQYRSCLSTGKAGGNITVDYTVTIIGGAGTSNILNTLIYDFSGSSYHYNSDYSVGGRIAVIVDPSLVTISKNFNPDPTNAGGTSVLTFTLTNPNGAAVSDVSFSDALPGTPGVMKVANPPNASTSGCGTPLFSPAADDTTLNFSNGTIPANGTCTVSVNVTVPAAGTYDNTSGNVFVGSVDTGNNASDSLTVSAEPPPPACTSISLATWIMDPSQGTVTAPPLYWYKHPDVSSAVATDSGAGVSSIATNAAYGNPANSWASRGYPKTGTPTGDSTPYIQVAIDTSQFAGNPVSISFDFRTDPNWGGGGTDTPALYVFSSTTGLAGSWGSAIYTSPSLTTTFQSTGTVNATATGASTTYFRITARGATNTNADLLVDNITITGCGTPDYPTLTKSFSPDPVAVGGASTLTFTITNPNTTVGLSGLKFTDSLPADVEVAATPNASTTCGGSPTWSPTAGSTLLTFGDPTGATLAAGGSCTVNVDVTVTTAGPHTNVSGFISSTETGTNTTPTGYATDTITAILPPTIEKLFSPNPILPNGTSTLTFTITNPNQNDTLTGVAFTDTFPTSPAAVTVASPLTTSNTCGGSLQDNLGGALDAGDAGIRLVNGTVAGGSTCTVSVNITAPSVGSYDNTSGAVTANVTGGTDTASDTLEVEAPNPAIALLKQVSTSPTGPWLSFISVTIPTNVYYQFTVENTGDVPLSPVSLTDDTLDVSSCNTAWSALTLQVADADDDDHIATCVVGPVAAVSGSHTNNATATGTYSGTPYTSTSSAATYATPELTLTKSAAESYFTAESDVLNYSYVVENTGFVPLLGPVTVTDDKASVTCPAVSTVGDNDNYLDPGESLTCTASYTVTAGDVTVGEVTNTAQGSANGVDSNEDSVTVPRQLPDLSVIKANDTSGSGVVGTSFTWTLTVANTGTLDATFADGQTLLSDPLPASATYGSPTAGNFTNITGDTNISCSIDGGDVLTCTASGGSVTIGASTGSFTVSIPVTPTAGGNLSNTATVDPNNNVTESNEANNTGTDSLPVFNAAPAKSIVATSEPSTGFVSGTERVTIGEMVRYRISAQLPEGSFTNVQLVDNIPSGLQFLDDGTATAAFVCTNTGANCITSSTLSGAGLLIAGNSPSVTPTFVLPGGAISGGPFGNGTDVTFSLGDLVNSDGDADLEYVVVEFNALVLNVNSSPTINQGTNNVDGSNVPNFRSNNTDFQVNGVKIGSTSANATVNIAEPAITDLAKTVSVGPYLPNGSITYTLTFSNTTSGNTNAATAFDIVLTDELDANLTPGAVNISSTQGTSGVDTCVGGTTFTASSGTGGQTVTVDISCLDPGESVTVTIDATISGSAAGASIDNTAGLTYTSLPGAKGNCGTAPFSCANVGASGSGTGERNGSGGTGADTAVLNNYADVSDTVSFTVTGTPALNVTKSETSTGPYGLGDPISYAIVVENTGDVTLTNVTVSDPDATVGVCAPAQPSTLAPGETMTCPASYAVTQADVDAGSFTNTATADSDETGPDTDSETVAIAQNPALNIIKEVSDDNSTWVDSVNVAVGDTVYFRITVDNTGDVPLTGVTVNDDQCTLSGPSGDTNNNSILDVDETWVYTCSITAVVGTHVNTATVDSNETTEVSDTASYTALSADLAITKTVDNPSPIFGENVVFTITVTNNGPSDATGVAVDDLLPAGLDYVSDNGGGAYDSNTGIWTIGSLNFGDSVSLEITATVTQVGSITNTASVAGNEVDPDPGNNESSAEVGGIFDPPTAIKTFNEAGLPELEFRMVWINSGNTTAIDVQVTDNIPTGTTYVAGSVTCEPRGSSSNAAAVSPPLSPTAVPNSFCGYDAGNNRIQWQGTIGPDDGNLTEEAADNEVVITFRVTVDDNVNQVQNQGFARVDVDNDGDFEEETVLGTSIIGSNQVVWTREPGGGGGGGGSGGGNEPVEPLELPYLIPVTGFAPGMVTLLPEQPQEKNYLATDVWVEVPRLGLSLPITGVPLVDGEWDVSWLGAQAGWLEGTAFPSWRGNSALTAHVTLSDGKAGPFANLGSLKWGDKIIVHAYGYMYVYEVRVNKVIVPSDTSVLKHEEKPWLTLLTCKNYNETTGVYANRIAVRAILTGVQMESSRVIPKGVR